MLLGGTNVAEAVIAGVQSFPGPHGKLYLTVDADPNGVVTATAGSIAILRSGTSAWMNVDGSTAWEHIDNHVHAITVATDPNGVVTASAGSIAVLTDGSSAWVNVDGGTTWVLFSVPIPPSTSALTTYADIDFRETTPIDLKALGDVPFVRQGVTFNVKRTDLCQSMAINSSGLYIGNNVSYQYFSELTGLVFTNIYFKPRDAIGIGPSALREQWIWMAFENDESASRDWSSIGGAARIEIWLDGVPKNLRGAGFYKSTGPGNTHPKRMFCSVGGVNRETINQLAVPVGEMAVFAYVITKFNDLMVYVGATVGGNWPARGNLNLLTKFVSINLTTGWTDAGYPATVLDYTPNFDYHFRFVPPGRLGSTNETWMRITRIKIEAEAL